MQYSFFLSIFLRQVIMGLRMGSTWTRCIELIPFLAFSGILLGSSTFDGLPPAAGTFRPVVAIQCRRIRCGGVQREMDIYMGIKNPIAKPISPSSRVQSTESDEPSPLLFHRRSLIYLLLTSPSPPSRSRCLQNPSLPPISWCVRLLHPPPSARSPIEPRCNLHDMQVNGPTSLTSGRGLPSGWTVMKTSHAQGELIGRTPSRESALTAVLVAAVRMLELLDGM